jgi:DNA-directed RNA polymerase subunit RPC12/RpoP
MTKVRQVAITCSSCGNKFPAMNVYSTSSFLPQPSKESVENNGVCPNCGTKNDLHDLSNLEDWNPND